MSNTPKSISFTLIDKVNSTIDNVTKYILADDIFGKNEVSVIRKSDKIIFCVPTQTNCKMGCAFCHLNGTTRKSKNLSIEWFISVVDYLVNVEKLNDYPNDLLISYMGAGEPLLNVNAVTTSITYLYCSYPRIRFGISTMMPNMSAISTLTEWAIRHSKINVKLHLSVHGIFNRSDIINSPISANEAISKLHDFHKLTINPIEYHYTLVDGVNDSVEELTAFNSIINGIGTVKFLTLSESDKCKSTKLSQDYIRGLFPMNTVEFYDPPGRDVGSSCGMFNRELYNEELPNG